MAETKNNPDITPRIEALREVARQRLIRLEAKTSNLLKHLEAKPNDRNALRYVLHQLLVEQFDIRRNLADDEWYPRPKRKKEARQRKLDQPPVPVPRKGKTQHQPGTGRHSVLAPVPCQTIPENQKEKREWNSRDDPRLDYTTPPFVQVALPTDPTLRNRVIAYVEKFKIDEISEIVKRWALEHWDTLDTAKLALRNDAQIAEDLLPSEPMERRRAIWHKKTEWVDGILDNICAGEGISNKDVLRRRLEANLRGFFQSVNSGKHTNPQFPYLSETDAPPTIASVTESLTEFWAEPDAERWKGDPGNPKKRPKIKSLQSELGKASRGSRSSEKSARWAGRSVTRGQITRRREGALLWDKAKTRDALVLALPMGGTVALDLEAYVYMDGSQLGSDGQLANATKTNGKSCILLPLILKHDFLRWYTKHVWNHDPNAPPERRCTQSSFQFVLVKSGGTSAGSSANETCQLYIRPVFQFYSPEKSVPNTKTFEIYQAPECRYLIGVDVGINYPYWAVVLDTEEKRIIPAAPPVEGRKEEWKRVRHALAYYRSRRDRLRNDNAPQKEIERENKLLRQWRKKDRGLNAVSTVESIAGLVEWAERELGPSNYCFVLEELQDMNLGRNNRVKHHRAIRDALINQMRKQGYVRHKDCVDGVCFVNAYGTSRVAPSGWYLTATEVEQSWKNDGRPIGRRVGNWYSKDADERGKYERGRYYGQSGRRPRFILTETDIDSDIRRRSFGPELFWDPTPHAGFQNGIVFDADFIGAFNLAVRPLAFDGHPKKGFTMRDHGIHAQRETNTTIALQSGMTVYEFVEVGGDPHAALRKTQIP